MSKGHAYSQYPATSTTQCCPSSSCHRTTSGTSYRDVLLGDDHMEHREIKLYG